MPIVNDTDKQAAKAALARLVVHGRTEPTLAATAVRDVIVKQELQVGDLANNLGAYAKGVQMNAEGYSNRKWAEYPGPVKKLAGQIVKAANNEIRAETA